MTSAVWAHIREVDGMYNQAAAKVLFELDSGKDEYIDAHLVDDDDELEILAAS